MGRGSRQQDPPDPPDPPKFDPPKVHIPPPPPAPKPPPPPPAPATAKAVEVQNAQRQQDRDAQNRDGIAQSVLAGETAPLLQASDPDRRKKSVLG